MVTKLGRKHYLLLSEANISQSPNEVEQIRVELAFFFPSVFPFGVGISFLGGGDVGGEELEEQSSGCVHSGSASVLNLYPHFYPICFATNSSNNPLISLTFSFLIFYLIWFWSNVLCICFSLFWHVCFSNRFCFGLVPNMQNVKGSCICNVLFFSEKIPKSCFWGKFSPHFQLWFQFGSILKLDFKIFIRRVQQTCHHLMLNPSCEMLANEATSENWKNNSLLPHVIPNGPKIFKP